MTLQESKESHGFNRGSMSKNQVLKCGAILVVVMGLSMMSQGTALSGMSSQINTLFSANGETAVKTSDRNDSDTDMEKDGIQYVSSTLEIWSAYTSFLLESGTACSYSRTQLRFWQLREPDYLRLWNLVFPNHLFHPDHVIPGIKFIATLMEFIPPYDTLIFME